MVGQLILWYDLTKNLVLPDDANLMQVRAGYPNYPNALKPPFVLEGDDMADDTFWIGDLFNAWAENWFIYWTGRVGGVGNFVMTAFEDCSISQALKFLSAVGRADNTRELVLRTGSDYDVQPNNETPAQFLLSENNGGLSGYQESLNDAYIVGSVVVKEVANHWDKYKDHVP